MSKKEENLLKPQETTSNSQELTQEEIEDELNRLDRGPVRADETMEEYSARENEKLQKQKSAQEKQDNEEIDEVRNEINAMSETQLCEKDLLDHLNSPTIHWGAVEGRINNMLSEIQNVERSDESMEVNTKVSEHIVKWLQENVGKYDAQTLAQEAIKHASNQAETNYTQINQESHKEETETTENVEEKTTTEGIKDFFDPEKMATSAKESLNKKTIEYDKRIRDMLANDPNDPRLKGALEDFKQWTKQDWTEDFSIE